MDPVATIREAASAAGLGVPEIATRAGLSRATTYRIFDGTTDPRWTDLRELFVAVGLGVDLAVSPLHDATATPAARALVQGEGGPLLLGQLSPAEALWRDRLHRLGHGNRVVTIREAGIASSVLHDSTAVGLRSEGWDVDRLVSAGRASGRPWALSGWAALSAMGHELDAPTILWTTDVRRLTQLLADTMSTTTLDRADVIVREGDERIFDRSVTVEDVVLVDSFQALVDCVGLGGDAERVALEVAGGPR
jgi:hypothetical protein